MANKNGLKVLIIAISALILLLFTGATIYFYSVEKHSTSGLLYFAPGQQVATQTIVQTTTQPGPVYGRPIQQAQPPVPVDECKTEKELEDTCRAANGCSGSIKKTCVSGKWVYSLCTTSFNKCDDGECKLDCRSTKQRYVEKYGLNDKTMIFYYLDDQNGGMMKPFMERMDNVLMLTSGKDVWFEGYLGLKETPTIMCFGNNAYMTGVKTEQEVKDFKERLCSAN